MYVIIRLVQFHLPLTQEKSLLTTIYAFNRAAKLLARLPRRALSSRSGPGQRKTSVFGGESSRVHLYFPAGQVWGSIGCALELRTPGNGQELRKDRENQWLILNLGP